MSAVQWIEEFARTVFNVLFDIGSNNSLPGMFVALCIAVGFTFSRLKRQRSVRLAVLRRAILPKRIIASASGRTDLAFTLASMFIFSLFLGAVVISETVARPVIVSLLVSQFGPPAPSGLPAGVIVAVTTIALYLSYEFAYWLDHYLCHRFEILWKFHAVHHSATSLSPLTSFRVHPVDVIIFANILGLVGGITGALLEYGFGRPPAVLAIGGRNGLILAGFMLLTTLQHSHFWITFTGIWGKLFLSPAHHQIHHSSDPRHFNKNLGSTLAIFDLLFRTLHVPERDRTELTFGVTGIRNPHGLVATIFRPFAEALQCLWRSRDGHAALPPADAVPPGIAGALAAPPNPA